MSSAVAGVEHVAQDIGHGVSQGAHAVGSFFHNLFNPPSPNITQPNQSQTPNQAIASTTAIQTQLTAEQNARSTSSILTSPGGLTDEPTTTSSLLTGA